MGTGAAAPAGAVMAISDLHLGLWGERNTHLSPKDKARALAAMVRAANASGATIVLNGDILDERGGRKALKREACLARAVLEAAHVRPVYVRGNHDRWVSPRKILKRLGPCAVVRGPLHADPLSGVVATHGHILEARRARRLIADLGGLCKRQYTLMNRWMECDQLLQGELDAFDDRDAAAEGLARVATLRQAFERAECMVNALRSWAADRIRRLSGRRAKHLWNWADGLDLRSIRRAAQLADVLHGWCATYGHNHTPGLHRRHVLDVRAGLVREVLVANSGSFVQHKQPITCVLAAHPGVALLTYDPARDEVVESAAASLIAAAATAATTPPPVPRPAPVAESPIVVGGPRFRLPLTPQYRTRCPAPAPSA